MPRYQITIEYDGRNFCGWQRQKNALGVQEVIEGAIFKVCGESVSVFGGGRTDAGVHALGQVAHMDIAKYFEAGTIRDALNNYLRPHPISIVRANNVPTNFHARFSAVERSYLYRIRNRRAPLALEKGLVWWVPSTLNVAAMDKAAKQLVGYHDFSTFRSSGCQAKSPLKTLNALIVERRDSELIEIRASARSFLYKQIRNIVGSLRLVGEGKWPPIKLKEALQACDRKAGGATAPADGLYLTGINYNNEQ